MTGIDLLIFDLDGTLVDSKQDIANCVNLTLLELGLEPIPDSTIYKYVGHGVRSLIKGTVDTAHGANNEAVYDRAMVAFDRFYADRLLEHTSLFPGMADVLERFKLKKKAIITNKPQKYTDPMIAGLGLKPVFDLVLGREACAEAKPHPMPVNHVLQHTGVAKHRAVIIGDTEVDIQAGQGAGILTCGVLFGFGNADVVRAAKPDFLIQDARELLDLFH